MKKHTDTEDGFYHFSALVDIDSFSQLLDKFYKATGIPNGLIDPDGEILSRAGWCDACAKFHRINPDSMRQCEESNLKLMPQLREGEIASRKCNNGLYDYATPIVIEGHQLAALFLGQILDSPPDLKFFRAQAKRFGFDEEEYLNAIQEIPIISKTQMEAHMDAMAKVTQILADNGLAKLRETRLKNDLSKSTEQRIQVQDLLDLSPIGVGWSDAEGNIEYINHQFTELFGYTIDDLPNLEAWYSKAYPDAGFRKETIEPWRQRVDLARQLGVAPPELEVQVRCKDGGKRHVLIRVSWVGDKRLVNFTNITAHWQSEQRNRTHNAMLEMVAKAEPLPHTLNALAIAVEAEAPSSICSILLLDQDGKHLLNGAAPNLPDFYNDAINGIEIGDGVGSCGTAAFLGQRVIVEDISTHEYWRDYADIAQQAGLAACWSEPIISSDGKIFGTFAIYHPNPAVPSLEEIERITYAANLAAIAIENQYTRDKLIKRELQFRTLAENAPVNIARYDLDGRRIYINPRFAATFSGQKQHLLGSSFSEQTELPYRDKFHNAIKNTIQSGKESSFEIEYPSTQGNIETHLINMAAERNETGAITGVLATGLDITERKQLEQQLTEREREFRTLAENVPINISRFDKDGYLIYANSKFATDFPLTIDKLFNMQLSDELTQSYSEIVESSVLRTVKDGVERSFEIDIPVSGGAFITHLITMVAERDTSGSIVGVLATSQNISERKRLQRELERQARLDFLTNLLNRRYFIELAKMELLRIQRYGGSISLILFDIDHFKQINDNYGHSSGDLVLKRIANITLETMREIDIVGRFGGEEFVVLLPQTDKKRALEATERLLHAIANAVLILKDGIQINFTASFGVTTLVRETNSADTAINLDDLLARTDRAMYQAKQNGRNQIYQDA